jgi:defect-in-organelle-trafficking protein DotB
MAARKPISLVKGDQSLVQTWPDEPGRFTEDHVDSFLLWCIKKGSSDISIQTDRPVYTEIHGILYPATYRPLDAADMAVFLHKIYGPDALARLASGTDLDVSYEIRPDRYSRSRFRVNITPILARGRDAAQITMRVLPAEPPRMADLNVEQQIIDGLGPSSGHGGHYWSDWVRENNPPRGRNPDAS